MLSLEQENSALRADKSGVKQSSFSDYSGGDKGDTGLQGKNQVMRELQDSGSSLSKTTFSGDGRSPQNSVQSQSQRPSDSDTLSNSRPLETIPENSDEHCSLGRTGQRARGLPADIHSSMPAARPDEVLQQPRFMFNSLQKASSPAFPRPHRSSPDVGFARGKDFLFQTGETGANFNPFRKSPRELDIEIESENSRFMSTRERSSRTQRARDTDQALREALLSNPELLFGFLQRHPRVTEKLSVLAHNFVFSGHPQLLSRRKQLYFSILEPSEDPGLSRLSQYTSLFTNVNKLSSNVLFRSLLLKAKQSADKMTSTLKRDSDHLQSFKGVFYMCDPETREYLATRYVAALRIQRFFRSCLRKGKKKRLNENNFQMIKIGMGKKFLFQLMRQSSTVMDSVDRVLTK